jgi:HK97 family phage major capsid protein
MATPDPNLINTTDFYIDPNTVAVDLSDSRKYSFVQSLGRQVQFGYAGGRYFNVSDLTGGFVAAEGGLKPVNNPSVTKGTIAVQEWAVVVPIPRRLYLADPDSATALIQERIPQAYARAFDNLATTGAGVSGQSNLSTVSQTVALGTTTTANGGIWADFNNGLRILAKQHKVLTGTVLDSVIEPDINAAVDLQGRPLFVDAPVGPNTNSVGQGGTQLANGTGRLLGRPAAFVNGITSGAGPTETVGYMGDWDRLVWGQIGGMDFMVSQEGTYIDGDGTTHSAVQENLILFRAEALLGVQVADPAAFVRVLNGTEPATS